MGLKSGENLRYSSVVGLKLGEKLRYSSIWDSLKLGENLRKSKILVHIVSILVWVNDSWCALHVLS